MTGTTAPYRSGLPAGRDGFRQLLHAEWTKIRTVRGWIVSMAAAAMLIALVAVLGGLASHTILSSGRAGHPYVPVGPAGESVADTFYYVHQPLKGNGSISVRVTSLIGASTPVGQQSCPAPAGKKLARPEPGPRCKVLKSRGGPEASTHTATQPWAKAGIIIKASASQGSAYAAVMVTGRHGVRLQYDYTGDVAGRAGVVSAASPRWLRLTRSGDVLTGFESADGRHWSRLGTVHLARLPSTVQAGLFVASPAVIQEVSQHFGGGTTSTTPSLATAAFDDVSLEGQRSAGAWQGTEIGGGPDDGYLSMGGGFERVGSSFRVSGSGDIAPAALGGAGGVGVPIEASLVGGFAGLIVLIVLATLFITAEYRRGLIRTSLAASPRRGRVLAAKAIVIGSVSFAAGLAGAAVSVFVGGQLLRKNGNLIYPVSAFTEVRVVVGTAAVLAVAAVLAMAVGTTLRRSAGAIAGIIVVVVLPYFLSTASILPAGLAQWLLRVTPAAGFAIEQTLTQYPQVSNLYTPAYGYYPLAPWAGFAVLCAYAALALGLALFQLRRTDA
jgi:ABC-type transport system involved in multi-copper enzyme maturation permease subunit